MTSGTFHIVPIADIVVKRDERQRRELTDIHVLADSIRRLGLIHPVVVTREMELVAGERRYAACSLLGWTHIPVQWVDELDPLQLQAIELEENVKRQDIPWQDQVQAVQLLHGMTDIVVGCVWPAEADVFPHRASEEETLLRDNPDVLVQ